MNSVNAPFLGEALDGRFQTPALLVDRNKLDLNIAAMARLCEAGGRQ